MGAASRVLFGALGKKPGGSGNQSWREGGGGFIGAQARRIVAEITPGETPAPPADTSASDAKDAALAGERQRRRLASVGRRSTLLTGPSGLSGPTPTRKPTLLGGGYE